MTEAMQRYGAQATTTGSYPVFRSGTYSGGSGGMSGMTGNAMATGSIPASNQRAKQLAAFYQQVHALDKALGSHTGLGNYHPLHQYLANVKGAVNKAYTQETGGQSLTGPVRRPYVSFVNGDPNRTKTEYITDAERKRRGAAADAESQAATERRIKAAKTGEYKSPSQLYGSPTLKT